MGLFSRKPKVDTMALAIEYLRQSGFGITQAGDRRYIAEDLSKGRAKLNLVGTDKDVLVMGGCFMGANARTDPGRFNWYLGRLQKVARVANFIHDPDYNLAAVGTIPGGSETDAISEFFAKWEADFAMASTGEGFAEDFAHLQGG